MERTEPVYRHQSERFESAANGSLADSISRRSEGNCGHISNRHCQTFGTATPNGLHNNWRTREAGTDSNDSPGRTESGNVQVSDSEHHSTGLNVSAIADINVSANDRFIGQQLLTYPRRDPEECSLNFGSAETPFRLPIQNRTAKRLTAAVRNRTQSNAGFRVSASVVRWNGDSPVQHTHRSGSMKGRRNEP